MKVGCITLLSLWLLGWHQTSGQKVIEENLPYTEGKSINFHLKYADHIQIRAWPKEEIYIKATVNINNNELNDAFSLHISDSAKNGLIIASRLAEPFLENKNNCNNICTSIQYEINMPPQADVSVESYSANIEITGLQGPVYAKTLSGFVDLSWPPAVGANIAMKSVTGELYTDLDVNFTNLKDEMPVVGYEIRGDFKGGGTRIHLESISNNIYLRKSN